jgi:archaellum component FlaC
MAQLDPVAKELTEKLDDLEQRIDRLRSLYEQFFQGIERVEPTLERDNIHRQLLELRTVKTRNTGLRFRINQMVARYTTFENYWSRVTKQIQDGTYQRDVFKARLHARLREEKERTRKKDAPEKEAPAAAQAAAKAPAPASQPAAASPATGLSDEHIEAIYQAYTTAKRRCRESTQGITKESLAASLRKQLPVILKQFRCAAVEFKVVIKDGKAVLKAVPKTGA